jgi:hypothetical protein
VLIAHELPEEFDTTSNSAWCVRPRRSARTKPSQVAIMVAARIMLLQSLAPARRRLAAVDDLAAHGLEDRLGAGEAGLRAAHHEGEGRAFRAHDAAGHGRVEHLPAAAVRGDLARGATSMVEQSIRTAPGSLAAANAARARAKRRGRACRREHGDHDLRRPAASAAERRGE